MRENPIILHITHLLRFASDEQLRLVYLFVRAIIQPPYGTETNTDELN